MFSVVLDVAVYH